MREIRWTRFVLWAALIGAVAIAARLFSFCGITGSDDAAYARLADEMAKGRFVVGQHREWPVGPQRLGIIVPPAVCMKIAGADENAILAYPFLTSLCAVLLVGWGAALFFGPRAGLAAALLWALLPIDARNASILVPDPPAAFWLACAVLILYCASIGGGTIGKCGLGAVAGLALAIAWLTKETAIFIAPTIICLSVWALIRDRRNLIPFAVCAGVLLLAVFSEALMYHSATGDALYRIHDVERISEFNKEHWTPEALAGQSETGLSGSAPAILKKLFLDGPKGILVRRSFGLLTATGLLALLYGVVIRARGFLIPGLWYAALFLTFNFGSTSFREYRPLSLSTHGLQLRYLYPILFPSVILTAGFFARLAWRGEEGGDQGDPDREPVAAPASRRSNSLGIAAAAVLAAFVVSMCIWGIARNHSGGVGSVLERQMAHVVSPDDRVFTDSRTASVLKLFWGFPDSAGTVDFEGSSADQIASDSYVLVNENRLTWLGKAFGYDAPAFYGKPPAAWRIEKSTDGGRLYYVP